MHFCFLTQKNSYDHIAAIYLLLHDRVRTRSMSQDNSSLCHMTNTPMSSTTNLSSGNKHSLDSQRRRPSTIAEQAMRKLGLGSNHHGASSSRDPRETSLSPRHHNPIDRGSCIGSVMLGSGGGTSYEHSSMMMMPSNMIQLRDTNIRGEQSSALLRDPIGGAGLI